MTEPYFAEEFPKALKPTRIVLFVQSLLGIVGALLLLVLVGSAPESADGSGLVIALSLFSLVLAGALLFCAVQLPNRPTWLRATVIAIEAITCIDGVITLFYAMNPLAVLRVVFALLVVQALLRKDVRDWFAAATPV